MIKEEICGRLEYTIVPEDDNGLCGLKIVAEVDGFSKTVNMNKLASRSVLRNVISGIIKGDTDREQLMYMIEDHI